MLRLKLFNAYCFLFSLSFFLPISIVVGQSYFFKNYNVEEGLIQSQVNGFCQDKTGMMWIATIGGLSVFDGTNFKNYTKDDGLPDNCIRTVFVDKSGIIWCGTSSGLSKFNGRNFVNYNFSNDPTTNFVTKIIQYKDGTIWFTVGTHDIFKIVNDKPLKVYQTSSVNKIEVLVNDKDGNIWAGGYNTGLLLFKNKKWQKIALNIGIKTSLHYNNLFAEDNKLWICTNEGLFFLDKNQETHRYNGNVCTQINSEQLYDIKKDQNNSYWIGTGNGVYKINSKESIHYTKQNNFISSKTNCIEVDFEGNIWLGSSSGDGFFIYTNLPFKFLNESTGLPSNSVRSLVKDSSGKIWIATHGGGLSYFINGKIVNYIKADLVPNINDCYLFKNLIWLGLDGSGLISYDNNRKFKKYLPAPLLSYEYIYTLYADKRQRLWIGSSVGAAVLNKGKINKVEQCEQSCFSFLEIGNDSILIATTSGLYLIHNGKNIFASQNPILKKAVIYCMIRRGDKVWMGTDNDGVLIWNIKKDSIQSLSTRNGMASNMIYNLSQDFGGIVYAGTGRGIHKISEAFDGYKIHLYDKNDGLLGLESNLNATVLNNDSTIWFGTTKGVFILDPLNQPAPIPEPKVILQNVLLFSKKIKKQFVETSGFQNDLPEHLSLDYNQNSLSFYFKAITFIKQEKIKYQYFIEGLEKNWCEPTYSTFASYTSLPPGNYIFKARALRDGKQTGNIIEYPFVIQTPFYLTVWFKVLLCFLLIASGFILQFFRHRRRQRALDNINKIKAKEQKRLQERISEDFHDEMGNRITRISLLTEILKAEGNKTLIETQNILDQIKTNASELYSGTSDIIWSLNIESNSLSDIMNRILIFGKDFFEESSIHFRVKNLTKDLENYKLQPGAGQNILLIVKESFNNILKYSLCKNVSVTVESSPGFLVIQIIDDGKGFDVNMLTTGHGIENMIRRGKRINAQIKLTSQKNEGTNISISLKR